MTKNVRALQYLSIYLSIYLYIYIYIYERDQRCTFYDMHDFGSVNFIVFSTWLFPSAFLWYLGPFFTFYLVFSYILYLTPYFFTYMVPSILTITCTLDSRDHPVHYFVFKSRDIGGDINKQVKYFF